MAPITDGRGSARYREPMNIIHTARRFLGLHPQRRQGEAHYTSRADVIAAIRKDLYVRRFDDVVGKARAAFAKAESDVKRANLDGTVKPV